MPEIILATNNRGKLREIQASATKTEDVLAVYNQLSQIRGQIEVIKGTPVYRRRGSLLPIAYLDDLLGLGSRSKDAEVVNIVVLQADGCEFGLVVDGINDTQEIVVKPLGKQLKGLSAYAGATIMGRPQLEP